MTIVSPSEITDVLYEGCLEFDKTETNPPPASEVIEQVRPQIVIGRPKWWNVTDVWRRECPSLLSAISSDLRDRDAFLVRFSCSFHPACDTPLNWARFSVRLSPSNREASKPIALDLHPFEVYEAQHDVRLSISPALKFEIAEVNADDVGLHLQYDELLPITTAVSMPESNFCWDVEPVKKAYPLHGDRWFHALIGCQQEAPGVSATLEVVVDVIIRHSVFRAAVRRTDTEKLFCLICT